MRRVVVLLDDETMQILVRRASALKQQRSAYIRSLIIADGTATVTRAMSREAADETRARNRSMRGKRDFAKAKLKEREDAYKAARAAVNENARTYLNQRDAGAEDRHRALQQTVVDTLQRVAGALGVLSHPGLYLSPDDPQRKKYQTALTTTHKELSKLSQQ
jgi:hypothetical protein